MTDKIIKKNEHAASTTELKDSDPETMANYEACDHAVRLWCSQSPDYYTLQVRTFGGIGQFNSGKSRRFISQIGLTGDDILELAEYVKAERKES